MLTPSASDNTASVVGRRFVRLPDSIWAIADQLSPEWNARASRLQPRRSRAARSRRSIAEAWVSLTGSGPRVVGVRGAVTYRCYSTRCQMTMSSDSLRWSSIQRSRSRENEAFRRQLHSRCLARAHRAQWTRVPATGGRREMRKASRNGTRPTGGQHA
jgi:hypothetical protein